MEAKTTVEHEISAKDIELVKLLAEGKTVTEIRQLLKLQKHKNWKVVADIERLKSNLRCHNSAALVAYFIRNKLIS